METKFQTSFIPKKPLPTSVGGTPSVGLSNVNRPRHRSSLFFNLAIFLFLISLGAAGGMYAWETISISAQDSYKQALADKQKQFNPDLINELKGVNTKIDTAKKLLSSHLALSNIFSVISRFTVENIRFFNLDVTGPSELSQDVGISMNGQGRNLSAVAFQGDVLSSLSEYGLSKVVRNPIIADPNLEQNGSVTFGFKATIDPATLHYMNSVSPQQ
jgi:hypothetical protein